MLSWRSSTGCSWSVSEHPTDGFFGVPSQAFSEYQIQQMTANFVDQFGFNDEEFADQDDNIK